ncbi:MAG: peptidoglycan DD-metalloendopeptidase family protein [Rhodospirillales bacterium]
MRARRSSRPRNSAARHAQQAAARAAALAQQRVEAANRLRAIETKVNDTQQLLDQTASAQLEAEEQVQQRAADLADLLPVALRLSLYPSETLLAAPVPPDKAIEGLLTTHGVSAEIARQVADLRAQQAAAAHLKQEVAARQATLVAVRVRQNEAAAELDRQLAATRAHEQQEADAEAEATEAAAALAAKAEDLRGAIAAMDEAERQAAAHAAEEARRATQQRNAQLAAAARARQAVLTRPVGPGLTATAPKATLVAGHIVRAWGAPAEDGPATGITFATAPAAYVASPCSGRVGFAAPFRSYGKLIIIECGGGYDFVLAGFDQLAVPVGRPLRAGEPLGRMPDYDTAHAKDRPGLYVELRKGGQPVDPMPYLNGKS